MTKSLQYNFVIYGRFLNSAIQFTLSLFPIFSSTPL